MKKMNRVVSTYSSKVITALFVGLILWGAAPKASAIPAFARKYKTACATCHNNWPELNDFGRAFKMNGFKFPKDDDQFVKDPPLMLGAEAQKEQFPYSIYPGELPILPIAFRYSGYANVNAKQPAEVAAANGFVPRSTLFTPNTMTILAAGSLGPSLAFWIDDDLSTGGSGAAGGLGDGYIKANNAFSFLHVPQNDMNVRYGQFELDLPFTQARTINLTDYAIFDETATAATGTTANPMALPDGHTGIEFGGYPNGGNTWWSVAVTDGATPRNSKDVYVHLSQRFNLEREASARKEVQVSGPTGVRDHTSLRVDGFAYYGVNDLNRDGAIAQGLGVVHEPFYRAGGAFDYKFRNRFELWGLYEHGRDVNKALNDDQSAFVPATAVTFSGGFLEAEYWAYPWLIATMRYDGVNSPNDAQLGVSRHDTRNSFVPAIDILVRPNVKIEAEYTYSFEQPVPGTDKFYRASQLITGIDYVF
ncbi:hypothetical protein DYQ86_26090 [Acidobacteria bacterium AB60]|nr:hypothetical protein DYQ86_26090 [Acidobacteria bacterium AB60]